MSNKVFASHPLNQPITWASVVAGFCSFSTVSVAGGFIFSDIIQGSVTHPTSYDGISQDLEVKVCIVPDSPNALAMETPIKNNIAVLNKMQSTSSNVRDLGLPTGTFDFESVALHEIGHCLGLSHTNLGDQSGVVEESSNYTFSLRGPDNQWSFDDGNDNIIGSADDVRNDDVNLNYFYDSINNPFIELDVVDASTFTLDLAQLPASDIYSANAELSLSATARYNTPFTEASMQRGTFAGEIQRTLAHDDISTLRYAQSGVDRTQGTADDYTTKLVYGGISDDSDCDINVDIDSNETGFAVCEVGGALFNFPSEDDIAITDAKIFFNEDIDWYFNNSAPCSESTSLVANEWKQISLPCQVGLSTGSTVEDVFGDDLDLAEYNVRWVLFSWEFTTNAAGLKEGAYQRLELDDDLQTGKGYWIITRDSGITVDVEGEFNSQIDYRVNARTADGRFYDWNMVGLPFRFPTIYADTQIIGAEGAVLSLAEADPLLPGATSSAIGQTACTASPAATADCKVARFGFIWRGDALGYEEVNLTSGALERFDGIWMFGGDDDYKIRFPMSALARTTP